MKLYQIAHEYQEQNKNGDLDDEISDTELFGEDDPPINLTKKAKANQDDTQPKITTSLDTLVPTKLLP